MAQVIVVGGGLAGLSAAHTLLERGANVLLLDKQGFVLDPPSCIRLLTRFAIVSWVVTLQRLPPVSTDLAHSHSKTLAFLTTQRSFSTTLRNPYVSAIYHFPVFIHLDLISPGP